MAPLLHQVSSPNSCGSTTMTINLIPPLPLVYRLYRMTNEHHQDCWTSPRMPASHSRSSWTCVQHPYGPTCLQPRRSCTTGPSSTPGKPSAPVDMKQVCNFLLAKKQSQKWYFNLACNAREQQQLSPDQEILFLSPAENEYLLGSIVYQASTPCSYIIKAQGKHYCRIRENIRPIHLNISTLPSLQSNP